MTNSTLGLFLELTRPEEMSMNWLLLRNMSRLIVRMAVMNNLNGTLRRPELTPTKIGKEGVGLQAGTGIPVE